MEKKGKALCAAFWQRHRQHKAMQQSSWIQNQSRLHQQLKEQVNTNSLTSYLYVWCLCIRKQSYFDQLSEFQLCCTLFSSVAGLINNPPTGRPSLYIASAHIFDHHPMTHTSILGTSAHPMSILYFCYKCQNMKGFLITVTPATL